MGLVKLLGTLFSPDLLLGKRPSLFRKKGLRLLGEKIFLYPLKFECLRACALTCKRQFNKGLLLPKGKYGRFYCLFNAKGNEKSSPSWNLQETPLEEG